MRRRRLSPWVVAYLKREHTNLIRDRWVRRIIIKGDA